MDNNDKIAKLVQRTQLLKQKLATAGYSSYEIQPVIVTLLSREEVTANLDDARDHGIAVLCREGLEDILNRVALPLNADKFFTDLEKLIPSSKTDSPFGLASQYRH